MSLDNSSSLSSSVLAEIQSLKDMITTLQKEVSSLHGALSKAGPSAPPKSAAKEPAPKKERRTNPAAAELPWVVFTKRISALLAKNGYKGTDLAVGNLQFCKVLRVENSDGFEAMSDEDILARRANWVAPAPKPREPKDTKAKDTPSVASNTSAPKEGKKRGPMSEEAKKARKEKMAAKKAAAQTQEPVTASVSSPNTEVAPEPVSNVATSSSSAPSVATTDEYRPVLLNGKRYLVRGLPNSHKCTGEDGVYCGGHAAYDILPDGKTQGDWAGLFHRVPKPHIDADAPEPTPEADDEELVFPVDE